MDVAKFEGNDMKNWWAISENPNYFEYHPCIHRWLREHPERISTEAKNTFGPSLERVEQLAEPLPRKILELYLAFCHIMSPEMRARVLAKLLGFGFTIEILEAMLEALRRERERRARIANAGIFDVLDENGYPILSNLEAKKKLMEEMARKKLKQKPRKKKDTKMSKQKKFKPGKRGQLKAGWPYHTGLRLLAMLLNIPHPDDRFISKARLYFDVQAKALFTIVIKALGLDENLHSPSSLDEIIALGCLRFCEWIARNVIAPADLINDEDVENCLEWKGQIPPKKKKQNEKLKKGSKGEKGKKQKKGTKGEVKQKQKKNKRKLKQKTKKEYLKTDEVNEENVVSEPMVEVLETATTDEIISTAEEIEQVFTEEDTGNLTENLQSAFLDTSMWYNPLSPEFLMDETPGPVKTVEFVSFFDTLMWKLLEVENFDLQPMAPRQVPEFDPNSRPRLCASKDNFWYVMTDLNEYVEGKSEWDTAFTLETVEAIADLIKTLVKTKKLSVKSMLELISRTCDAIKMNNTEVVNSLEVEMLDKKRTIMFERIFVKFFSTKFRDQDRKTCGYMETICRRAAVLVRFLYQHTAHKLWKYQRSPAPVPPTPSPVPSTPEPEIEEEPFDEEMFNNWNSWVQFLLRADLDSQVWQKWLLHVSSQELPDDKVDLILEAENWLDLAERTCNEAENFKTKAEFLEPVIRKIPEAESFNSENEGLEPVDRKTSDAESFKTMDEFPEPEESPDDSNTIQ